MTAIKKSKIVSFSCAQMYSLVDDINHYHEFLPYCTKSEEHYRDEDEVQATLNISAAGFTKSFTTRNLLQKNKMIELRLVDGPFSKLEGFWRFESIDEGCLVSLDMEFEFSGMMLAMLLGPIFEQITNKMVDAFCDRAQVVYA